MKSRIVLAVAILLSLSLVISGCASSLKSVGKMGLLDCSSYKKVSAFLTISNFSCVDESGQVQVSVSGVGPGVVNGIVTPTVQAGAEVGRAAVTPEESTAGHADGGHSDEHGDGVSDGEEHHEDGEDDDGHEEDGHDH